MNIAYIQVTICAYTTETLSQFAPHLRSIMLYWWNSGKEAQHYVSPEASLSIIRRRHRPVACYASRGDVEINKVLSGICDQRYIGVDRLHDSANDRD